MSVDERDRWTAFHFTQCNPGGAGQDDVAALLRRVATTIGELGDIEVPDITFRQEVDDEGEDWPVMTVYYHRREPD
jgi:hypothetical protein